MKQTMTAVEWLETQLADNLKTIVLKQDYKLMEYLFWEAKEMEKKQIIGSNRDGVDMCIMNKCSKSNKFITGEDYYMEKYKQ